MAFLISISLVASALNVFYRDVKYIIPLVIQLGMFVTPVIYSTSRVPAAFQRWYMLNPMAVVIDGVRKVVLHGQSPDVMTLTMSTVVVLLVGLFAYRYFKHAEVKFADLI